MKKINRAISMLIVYLFILTLIPMNFIAKQVKAFENNDGYCYSGETKYNEKNTVIKNKYNITGAVLKVEQYEDCSVVITNDAIYIIKDGKAQKVPVGVASLNSNISRQGKDLYYTPYYYGLMSYNLLKINLDSNKDEVIPFEGIFFDYNHQLQENNLDKTQNNWFSVLHFNREEKYDSSNYKVYKLLRIDATGKANELASLNNNPHGHYEEAFTNMQFDKNNNAWFEVAENDYMTNVNQYKLGRVNIDGSTKYIDFKDVITDYKIAENGDVWVIQGKTNVIKLDSNGKIITNYSLKDVKDISIDKDGGVWVLDENEIKKLEENKFVSKHSNIKDMDNLSVYNSEKIIASNKNAVCIINGKDVQELIVDNYIRNNTFVTKDNNGKIKILSTPENLYMYNIWDRTTNVSEILKDGTMKMDKAKYVDYYGKTFSAYNDNFYFTSMNTLYKLSRVQKQEVAVLFDNKNLVGEQYEYISKMEITNDGEIYCLSNKKIYKTDKNGQVKSISIDKVSKNNNASDKKIFYNLLKVNKGELFTLVRVGNTTKLFKVKDINNIEEDSNYILNKNGVKYYPVNIFANENNELQLVYSINDELKVYKRVNNSLVEDIRFNNQDENFAKKYNSISNMKKSTDGDLFIIVNYGMLYIKDKGANYFHKYRDGIYDYSINNIETGEDGSVYIATSNDGVIHYDSKLKAYNHGK